MNDQIKPDQPESVTKWAWMMDFCKDVGVNPADAYWWDRAEKKYYAEKAKEDPAGHGRGGDL
jgi:hypothetical protein